MARNLRRKKFVRKTSFQGYLSAPIKIEKLIPWGVGLGYLEGKPCFIERALEGEVVRAWVYKENAKSLWGETREVLESSASRIEPKCSYYGTCGGCDFQHVNYADQVLWKKKFLLDQLARMGGVALEDVVVEKSPEWNYRSRMRLHVKNGKAGFLKSHSKDLVEIKTCPVLVEEFENLWKQNFSEGQHSFQAHGGEVACDSEKIFVNVAGQSFPVSPNAFFQSNQLLLKSFVQEILEGEKGKFALDLFAGIGFFSAFLAPHFTKVIAVERDQKCRDLAESFLPKNVEYYSESLENWVQRPERSDVDLLIVDPPRTGIDAQAMGFFQKIKPKKLVYVSCNPSTFCRDLSKLQEFGYELDGVKGFDFYPQTSHLELVAKFRKN